MGKDPGSVPMDDPLALFLTWTTYGSWLPRSPWAPSCCPHNSFFNSYFEGFCCPA